MIGKRLKVVMTEKGVSTYQLASLLEVSPQQISRWRNSSDLKLSTAIQISKKLNVSLEEFVGEVYED